MDLKEPHHPVLDGDFSHTPESEIHTHLRVLITIISLSIRTGAEVYVHDLALELRRRGHEPFVYAQVVGELANALRDEGIPVSDSLQDLPRHPDIIHGQHYRATNEALFRFPWVPAIHVCHDHAYFEDRTPLHPRIYRHFGVSRACVDRVESDGIEPERTALLLNWVNLARFPVRAPLPEVPKRALVFSNYAKDDNHLTIIRTACEHAGLELDVFGLGVNYPITEPGQILGHYDLVFAKAKAAMEAMAVGTAVVLCDFAGIGPMVDSVNFASLRPLNFGFAALTAPYDVPTLLERIRRYDPKESSRVCELIRNEAGMERAISDLINIYREVIKMHGPQPRHALAFNSVLLRSTLTRIYRKPRFAELRRRPWFRRFLVNQLRV